MINGKSTSPLGQTRNHGVSQRGVHLPHRNEAVGSRQVFEKESLAIPGVHSLGRYNHVAAQGGLAPHQHPGCIEISLLVKGFQNYRVGGKTYQVKGGEQYISLPGEMHDTGSEPQDKGVLYWLILDVTREPDKFLFLAPTMARKLISEMLEFPSRHFASDHEGHATLDRAFRALLKIRKPDECTGTFQKVDSMQALAGGRRRTASCPSPRESMHLLEASNHLVYYILQTIAASRANLRTTSPVIQASLDFIALNQEESLSVAQVAEKVNLSESYFKILFREEVGLPPAEYMLRLKIEAAKAALSEPGCNITELAYRLGFSSSQYFATVFKRFTNRTPSHYMNGELSEMIEIIARSPA
jgi:AraC-like DNA-binding protein/quercetin dioxygenase-like cupin family protein